MIWFPADKMIVGSLIELPPGALVIVPKSTVAAQTEFAVRFNLVVENDTYRFLFYPSGLPRTQDPSIGWALNLEDWRDREDQTAAYLDNSGRGMRIECSGEVLDAQRADFWGGGGRGRAFLGSRGFRLLAGNVDFRNRQTFEIDPTTWLAEYHRDDQKVGWADGWRLVYGDLARPIVIQEYLAPIAAEG
jgi:hypothetical protein